MLDLFNRFQEPQIRRKSFHVASFFRSTTRKLTCASNSTLQIGDIDFAFAGRVRTTRRATIANLFSKSSGTANSVIEYSGTALFNGRWGMLVGNGTQPSGVQHTDLLLLAGKWHSFFSWHSTTNSRIYGARDGVLSSSSSSYTNSYLVGDGEFVLGGAHSTDEAGGSTFDGMLDYFAFFKPPTEIGDGTDGTLAKTMFQRLYNGGRGLRYSGLTDQEKTDFGLVSLWDFEDGSNPWNDRHGTNHLATLNGGPSRLWL